MRMKTHFSNLRADTDRIYNLQFTTVFRFVQSFYDGTIRKSRLLSRENFAPCSARVVRR